jgi:fatty acid desaturase
VGFPSFPIKCRRNAVHRRRLRAHHGAHIALLAPPLSIEGNAPESWRDYADLKRRVQQAGLLRKQPGYYAVVISTNLLLVALCLAMLVLLHNPWLRALDAVGLGLVSGQLGFQLHDAGHRQMFNRGWMNTAVGLFTGDALLGMSYGWWVSKHNRHHANPNHVDEDPDISVGAISYTREQALGQRGPLRRLAAYQAFFFFPMLFFLGFAMHASSFSYLARSRSRYRWLEVGILVVNAAAYYGFFFWLLGPWLGLVVIVLHKASGGFYLASVFAPNHKGMPQTDENSHLDFLRSQVLTARNVKGSRAKDFWYGSLNYQIEHHLFPGMPRNRLRAANRIVREYCAEIGVPYYETGMLNSYRELLAFLHEVGRPLRHPQPVRVRD